VRLNKWVLLVFNTFVSMHRPLNQIFGLGYIDPIRDVFRRSKKQVQG